jgi:beta-N-acetylhexosaminidase
VGLSGPALAENEAEALAALAPGGVVLFARNVSTLEATRSLVSAAREACGGVSPLLVCVDQEGGRVARLRFGPGPLPSALALGAAGSPNAPAPFSPRNCARSARTSILHRCSTSRSNRATW